MIPTGKTYYWLKLKADFFSSKEIRKLRSVSGGAEYVLIYQEMLIYSLPFMGVIFFDGFESDISAELALVLGAKVDDVRVVVNFLLKFGLMEQVDDTTYRLTQVEEMTGTECESAARTRKYREKMASLSENGKKTSQCDGRASQCDTDVTKCDTEIDIEKEKDIDKENEKEKEKEKDINYQQIADMYNDTCVSFPRLTVLSEARKKAIKARLNTYTVEQVQTVFAKAEESNFMKGANNHNWRANFDWIMKDSNFAKILDGNYDSRAPNLKTDASDKEWCFNPKDNHPEEYPF